MQVVLQETSGNLCNFMKQANQKRGSVTIFGLAQKRHSSGCKEITETKQNSIHRVKLAYVLLPQSQVSCASYCLWLPVIVNG